MNTYNINEPIWTMKTVPTHGCRFSGLHKKTSSKTQNLTLHSSHNKLLLNTVYTQTQHGNTKQTGLLHALNASRRSLAHFCEKQSDTNKKEMKPDKTQRNGQPWSYRDQIWLEVEDTFLYVILFYNDKSIMKNSTVCMDYFHSLCIFMCLS